MKEENTDKIPGGCHENKKISRLRSNLASCLLSSASSAATVLPHV